MRRRTLLLATGPLAGALLAPTGATAHGVRAGDVLIDHPYAPPSPVAAASGGEVGVPVYFRALQNNGAAADRLIGAHTERAQQARLPRGPVVLPPGTALRLRHDGPPPIELLNPMPPLRDGNRFTLTLRFERAGAVDVVVWVQAPRTRRP